MDAFESLMALLLAGEGYWTATSFKVNLTKAQKQAIGTPSMPRPEIDVLGYKASTNEVLVVECKSFIDSPGVFFKNGSFGVPKRYKLFVDDNRRKIIFKALAKQMVAAGLCRPKPKIVLCLAAAHIADKTDRDGLTEFLNGISARLFDEAWVRERLMNLSTVGYENDAVHMAVKLLINNSE